MEKDQYVFPTSIDTRFTIRLALFDASYITVAVLSTQEKSKEKDNVHFPVLSMLLMPISTQRPLGTMGNIV